MRKTHIAKISIGAEVSYTSASGKTYLAVVTGIPENPWHQDSSLPTVSLEFRDERGKLIRKTRVLPMEGSLFRKQTWKPLFEKEREI